MINFTDAVKRNKTYAGASGSCLFSQLDEEAIHETLLNRGKINDHVFNRPTSAITKNEKKE